MEHLNLFPYAPDGFVDPLDEYAQQMAQINPYLSCNLYAYDEPFAGVGLDRRGNYVSDEAYGGDPFQYVPTEMEVGAVIAMQNFASLTAEDPQMQNDPGMAALAQGLYEQASAFWRDLRQAAGTGW